ncbi:MAG TPA: serine hydrolase, partial [Bacteroidales bacterium]
MKSDILTIFLLLTLFIINSCKKGEPDLNQSPIDDIFANAGQNKNLRCLIVFKDNQIIKEKYFIGDSLSAHDVRSVTKSVMSTLIGIAIDKGIITSEENEIGDYLRSYVSIIDPAKANIKIRDVLSMTSGISGNELTDPNE